MNKDGIIIFVREGSFHFRDHLVQRNDAAAGKIPYLRVKQDDGAVFSRLRFVHKHIVEDIRILAERPIATERSTTKMISGLSMATYS